MASVRKRSGGSSNTSSASPRKSGTSASSSLSKSKKSGPKEPAGLRSLVQQRFLNDIFQFCSGKCGASLYEKDPKVIILGEKVCLFQGLVCSILLAIKS